MVIRLSATALLDSLDRFVNVNTNSLSSSCISISFVAVNVQSLHLYLVKDNYKGKSFNAMIQTKMKSQKDII